MAGRPVRAADGGVNAEPCAVLQRRKRRLGLTVGTLGQAVSVRRPGKRHISCGRAEAEMAGRIDAIWPWAASLPVRGMLRGAVLQITDP